MKLLFIGDVVGPPGLDLLKRHLPDLREQAEIDLVVANAENSANGSGLTPRQYHQLRRAGVDAVTLGDHIYKKRDIIEVLRSPGEPVCKPANFPAAAPGRDHIQVTARDGTPVVVMCVLGRTFMRAVDCPFEAADRVLDGIDDSRAVVVVDVHAEATADKYLLGHHLAGRVAAVLGTHTHIPTADEQILLGGTAFICDVGMTGPYAGIIGRKVDRVLPTVIDFVPQSYDVAEGDVRLGAALVEIDAELGRAVSIRRLGGGPESWLGITNQR